MHFHLVYIQHESFGRNVDTMYYFFLLNTTPPVFVISDIIVSAVQVVMLSVYLKWLFC